MVELERFLGSLQRVKQTGDGEWIASCPAPGHGQGRGDIHPSLSINRGNGSGLLLNCHAGCANDSIIAGAGFTWPELLPPRDEPFRRKTDTRKPAPAAAPRASQASNVNHGLQTPVTEPFGEITRYEIRDEAGAVIAVHIREDFSDGEKTFKWQRPDGTWGLGGRKLDTIPLYGIDRLPADALEILIVEGEKAADALMTNGIAALGTVTGAGKTPGDDALRPLLGRQVYLWPDNDKPGREHMERIGAALLRLGHHDVRVIDWKGAPPKGDAADLFALEAARDDMDALIDEAKPFSSVEEGTVETQEAQGLEDRPAFTEKFRATDLWATRLFTFLYQGQMKHCTRRGGWFTYDGKRWIRSECGEIERLAKELPRAILEIALAELEAEERAKMFKFAAAMESSSRIAAMLNLAATEEAIALPPDAFDSDPFKFNAQNGTLRFDPERATVELLPHNPEDLITNLSPAVWEGVIPPGPVFGKYLEESAGGDQALIAFRRRLAGYAMTGDMREQVFEYAYGPEAGGKGTETRARADVMGTYARAAEMETFLTSRSDKVRNDLAGLVGSRMVTATETQEGQVLDEGLIRMLTGQDRMTARFLFKENFEFSCGFKIRFEGNHRPTIKSCGGATWRRLLIIPFDRTVPEEMRDKILGDKLKSPKERSGILGWMAEGALEWLRDGLKPPDKVRAAVAAYRLAEDRLAPFLEDRCKIGESLQVTAAGLYGAYKTWCESSGERPMSQRSLGLRLEEKGFEKIRTYSTGRAWRGLAIPGHDAS